MNETPRNLEVEGYLLQIKKIGNSVGLILPKELLARLKLKEGDKLYVVEQTEARHQAQSVRSQAREGDGDRAALISENIADTYRGAGKMTEPEWLDLDIVIDFHAEQLALFGGPDGIRDLGLAGIGIGATRRTNLHTARRSLPALAAAYGFGIARNHPFVDGNKRTALASMIVFLDLNGLALDAPQETATAIDAWHWPPARSAKMCLRAGSPTM